MTKIKDLEWFCPQPFMNAVVNHDRVTKPCCVLKGWPNRKIKESGKTSVMEVHNSDLMKKFRNEFLTADEPTPLIDNFCLVCKEQEKHSKTESHRLMYAYKFDEEHGEYREHTTALEEYIDTDHSKPFYLTMEYNAPNNFCNLKCNMCGPFNSSTYAKENKAIGITEGKGMKSHWLAGRTWVNEEDDMNQYTDVLKNLIELKLVGGETLALPQNYEMMDKAIEMGVSKQMRLVLTTNATLTPKMGKHGDVFDYVPHFKDCQMNVSIECWGKKNNYIRFPSKWEKIMENVERFSKMPRTKILFATCVSSLTIGYLHEVAEGVDALIEKQPDIFNEFATGSLVIGGDNLYTVTAIPLDLRDLYLESIYENAPERHTKTFMKLAKYLTDMPFDESLHNRMMIDVAKRDKFRGTVLTDVFPEWEPYYEKL
jgi:hypothetical protein